MWNLKVASISVLLRSSVFSGMRLLLSWVRSPLSYVNSLVRPCVGCGMGRGSRTPTILQPGPPGTGMNCTLYSPGHSSQNRRLEREPQLHLHSTPCLAHHYWALPGAWLAALLSFPQFIWTGSCSSCSLEPSWFCAGLPQRVSTMAVRQRGQGDGVREYCQEEQELQRQCLLEPGPWALGCCKFPSP